VPLQRISSRLFFSLQFFDGGSRRNPGHAGCGAALFTTDSSVAMDTDSAYLGVATSNVAEYQGLILGLKLAYNHGIRVVDIRGDSNLVINQLNSDWKVNNEKLKALLATVHSMLPKFDEWNASHVYREQNSVADGLVNDAIDEGIAGHRSVRTPSEEMYCKDCRAKMLR
jgi:ribonuclease HI